MFYQSVLKTKTRKKNTVNVTTSVQKPNYLLVKPPSKTKPSASNDLNGLVIFPANYTNKYKHVKKKRKNHK